MGNKGKKRLFSVLTLGSGLTACAVFIGAFIFLPSDIHLLKGKEQTFTLGLPLSAEFSSDSIGAVSVNNSPVTGNIHINLTEPFSVKPEQSGAAKVSLSLFGLIPVKTVSVEVLPVKEVIPGGMTVGVAVSTEGVLVLGTGFVNGADQGVYEPAKGVLKTGDLILKAGGRELNQKEDLMQAVEENGDKQLQLVLKRDGKQMEASVTPVKSLEDGSYKLGIWIRDSTQGIGTLTYVVPETNEFGALGHGIYDVDTQKLMSIKSGLISESEITGINKGAKGTPGELLGNLDKDEKLGTIKINSEVGLYGTVDKAKLNRFPNEKMEIGLQQDVKEGEAVIRSNILNNEIKDYTINIESINKFSASPDKGMVIKITDERLLNETSGIIQGMSGSPIIQNEKLIGAVTHVFVQDPSKGYGIFIENMLNQGQNLEKAS